MNFLLSIIPGGPEIFIILFVILLLFGGRKIPELMRGIGKGARELKKGLNEDDDQPKKDDKPVDDTKK